MKDNKLLKFGIGCISDEKYICLLKPFITSLASTNPGIEIYITLVDCDGYHIDELLALNSNIVINMDSTDICTKRKHLARHGIPIFDSIDNPTTMPASDGFKGPRWLMSDQACYCSNSRYRVILEMISQQYNPILFMDVDAIVRKPLTELRTSILNHDISIKKEYRKFDSNAEHIRDKYAPPDNIDWHCGIIGVNNNHMCRTFFSEVKQHIEKDMFNWDADQDCFNLIYNKYADKLRLYNIPQTYKDDGQNDTSMFSKTSHVWCGAGQIKYNNRQYIDEQKKYTL